MNKYRDFDNKSYFFMLRRTKASPLSFNQNVVYSYLTHRAYHNEGASMMEIHRETGIDRHRTLPQLCEGLATFGLAENRESRQYALPPANGTAEWFHRQSNPKGVWARHFQFFRYYPLSEEGRTRLTLSQNAVLWLMYSFWDGNPQKRFALNLSRKGLATLLHLDRDTVANAISLFKKEGIIDLLRSRRRPQYFAAYLAPPTQKHLLWFKDQGGEAGDEDEYAIGEYLKNVPPVSAVPDGVPSVAEGTEAGSTAGINDGLHLSSRFRLSEAVRQQEPEIAAQVDRALDYYKTMLLDAKYTPKDIFEYWQLVARETRKLDNPCGAWCCAVAGFKEFFEEVETRHRENRSGGKYGLARNSLGLLRSTMPGRLRSMEQTFYSCSGGWRDVFWYNEGAYIK